MTASAQPSGETVATASPPGSYGAASLRALKGLDPVRKRPGMYIGDTKEKGYHHCLWEIVDNAIDEAMGGHATRIDVALHADGSASVRDDGRGIPVDIHPEEGVPGVILVLTTLHAGGKFGDGAYKTSGGLHGVGASAVVALSDWVDVEVKRDGHAWRVRFLDGAREITALERGRATREHGTFLRFRLSPVYFEDQAFDAALVRDRLRKAAYLNPGITISLVDERDGQRDEFRSEAFAEILDMLGPRGKPDILPRPFSIDAKIPTAKGAVQVMVALRYHDVEDCVIATFANNIATPWGGTHETGFREALLRAINKWGKDSGALKEPLVGDDVREGLVAAISVRVEDPEFEGQTKEKLGNGEVRGAVLSAVYEGLGNYFEENPSGARVIVQQALRAARAREMAKRGRESVYAAARVGKALFPTKLNDCSDRNPANRELFIVEGDSAGGSAGGARDPRTQAVLPLRGKILNVERADELKALKNEEIRTLMTVLGCGHGTHFDLAKLRYHKVIVMTDADVDGAHICTLLLTLLYRYTPALIARGHVYIAQPPLFRVRKGKDQSHYLKDEAALAAFFETHAKGDWVISRFKGLGEMDPEQLAETTMEPETRTLARVRYGEGERAAEATEAVFRTLMSDETPPRRRFFEERALDAILDV